MFCKDSSRTPCVSGTILRLGEQQTGSRALRGVDLQRSPRELGEGWSPEWDLDLTQNGRPRDPAEEDRAEDDRVGQGWNTPWETAQGGASGYSGQGET